jgi:hypothetical protein
VALHAQNQQREVLGITIHSHRGLETLLQGFNQAYNARSQRVLNGRSPERVCMSAWAQRPPAPTRVANLRPIHVSCLKPCTSSLTPKTSRIQTCAAARQEVGVNDTVSG